MNHNPVYSLRQGDVLLVDASYRGTKVAEPVKQEGDTILAYGEVTGHAHRIAAKTKPQYRDADAERFLQVVETTALTHEEHSAIFLSPDDKARGKYQQAFQVEDFGMEVRRVRD